MAWCRNASCLPLYGAFLLIVFFLSSGSSLFVVLQVCIRRPRHGKSGMCVHVWHVCIMCMSVYMIAERLHQVVNKDKTMESGRYCVQNRLASFSKLRVDQIQKEIKMLSGLLASDGLGSSTPHATNKWRDGAEELKSYASSRAVHFRWPVLWVANKSRLRNIASTLQCLNALMPWMAQAMR